MSSPEAGPNGAAEHLPEPLHNGQGHALPMPVVKSATVRIDPAHVTPPAMAATPNALALLKALRRRWLLAGTLGLLAAAVVGTLVWMFLPPAKQTAYAKLHMPSRPEGIVFDHPEGKIDFVSFQRTQVELIKSHVVLNAALRNPKVVQLDLEAVNTRLDPVEWLDKEIKVDFPGSPEIARISMSSDDPEQAKVLVDAVTNAYLQEIVNKQIGHRQKRLDQMKEFATAHETRLKRLRRTRSELAKLPADQKGLAIKQEMVQMQLGLARSESLKTEAELRRLELEAKLHKIRDDGTVEVPDKLIDEYVEKDPVVQKYKAAHAQMEERQGQYKLFFKDPNNPRLLQLQQQIEENQKALKEHSDKLRPKLREQLKDKVKNDSHAQLALLTERVSFYKEYRKSLDEEITRLTKEGENLNVQAIDVAGYEMEIKEAEATVTRLHSEIEKLTFELPAPPRVTRLEDEVVISRVDELPRKMKIAGGSAGGALALILLLIAFLEFRSRRIDSPEEVVHGLGLRLMGTLPAPPRGFGRRLIRSSAANASHWQSMLAESVDSARTLLMRAAGTNGAMRVVMVTSATSGEGKTSLATHLAASLARAGRKTLLIDCDLRNPAVHRLFDVPEAPGFCEALRGEAELSQAAHATAAPGLSIMPAGECDGDTIHLLAQGGVQKLIDALRPQYDFIVVDTAPVLPVADSLVIAQSVDGVLFSLLREVSRLPRVHAAYQRLALLGIPMLGAVVNGTHEDVYGYGQRFPISTGA